MSASVVKVITLGIFSGRGSLRDQSGRANSVPLTQLNTALKIGIPANPHNRRGAIERHCERRAAPRRGHEPGRQCIPTGTLTRLRAG
jgi:hypothetical protein